MNGIETYSAWWKENRNLLNEKRERHGGLKMDRFVIRCNEHNEFHSLSEPSYEGLGVHFERAKRGRLNRGVRTVPTLATFNFYQIWFEEGHYHRDDGPCIITYDAAGVKIAENWYEYNVRHRKDGPAQAVFGYMEGAVEYSWYWEGKFCGNSASDKLEDAPGMFPGRIER